MDEIAREIRFKIGNVVKWSNDLWIVTEWTENIIDHTYTIRCRMVSFDSANVSTTLTNIPDTSFHVENIKFIDSSAKSFIMRRLEKVVLGIE